MSSYTKTEYQYQNKKTGNVAYLDMKCDYYTQAVVLVNSNKLYIVWFHSICLLSDHRQLGNVPVFGSFASFSDV